MSKRTVSGITLTLLLIGMLALAFNVQPVRAATNIVPDDYLTIQEAINAANPGDTVYVKAGAYYEHVVVDKSLSLVGEDKDTTIIDGNGTGIVVKIGWTIRRIDHVILSGFTIRRSGRQWIHLPVMVSYPESGIFLREVEESVIGNNIIIDNLGGVTLHRSPSNVVKNNLIMNNEYGVTLSSAGEESVDNVILENTIANNTYGLLFDLNDNWGYSDNNHVYHNNFINNSAQALSVLATGSPNIWDAGYPSGGNYWSDYASVDLFSGRYQNETGSDGIGDSPYVIDENNTDQYPLMEPWGTGTPTANFAWTPSIGKIDEPITFDASTSTPNGGTIVKYKWDFGDDGTATGQIVTHAYTNPGTYTVTLNVTDSEGLGDTQEKQLQVVQPHGPTAEFTITPETAKVGETVEFAASSSLPGSNGTHEMPITEYRWDFGDGNQTTTSTPTVYHSFSTSGNYYVTLTVYAPGATPETDSTTKKVTITAIPVGGYSFLIKGYTTSKPLTLCLALLAVLTVSFAMIKRKTLGRTKRSRKLKG